LSRVLSNVADKYNVMTAPSRGYASYTYIKQAIERLPDEHEVTILHFADHDPSGVDMTRDLQERFESYTSKQITIERIALSYNQVQSYNLVPNPAKITDPRAEDYISEYGNQCWELDAIEPNELQRLVEEAIVKHIDFDILKTIIEKQEQERIELQKKFLGIEKKFREMGLL